MENFVSDGQILIYIKQLFILSPILVFICYIHIQFFSSYFHNYLYENSLDETYLF